MQFKCKMGNWNYDIDLDALTQTNTYTNKSRNIKRDAPPVPKP